MTQHVFAWMTDEAYGSIILAELQVALFRASPSHGHFLCLL